MTPSNTDSTFLLRRCVDMALAGIHREFPCHLPLVLDAPTWVQRPRDLIPAFYGCYDWHSAVHNHWLLVRWLSICRPAISEASDVGLALETSFAAENLAAEYQFLNHSTRAGFERPYGLAWLLQLCAELRTLSHPRAECFASRLRPLEELAARRFREWLPGLQSPVRTGEHGQTAFALGLVFDWARDATDPSLAELIRETALRFYSSDCDLPLQWEPSGDDFLSPSLATADLMRRIQQPTEFADWLSRALPGLASSPRLFPIAIPSDLRDGKAAHVAGLNFSRAWMLDGAASGLPVDDRRRHELSRLAQDHIAVAIPVLDSQEYSVTHWVGSFAMYALTKRGVTR
jgi:Protein of unknown function (DUF2891)